MYEVELPDGKIAPYAVNSITQEILSGKSR